MTRAADIAPMLNPALNRRLIGDVFRRGGRVHIGNVLTAPSAERIRRCLDNETAYVLSVTTPAGAQSLRREENSPAQIAQVNQMAIETARTGFAFQYDKHLMSDHGEPYRDPQHYLAKIVQFLNGAPFLDFCRDVTGLGDIARADAQATCYRPGHFLTRHDDDVDGLNRRAAYVLNFTPGWNPDWGGLLLFPDAHGHVAEGYAPAWNALNLLAVPQAHAVSLVAPFAGGLRYSITGWLLSR
jgi:Rps23 Pro-64 3,4-dihydroxylase Tpa1-like proline 4-hydroxylase